MICYFDSSALVKKYIQEQGSDEVLRLWDGAEKRAVSSVTYAEVVAAFQRLLREAHLSSPSHQLILQAFRADWEGLVHIPVSKEVNLQVDAVISRYVLRGFDAIHLASALSLQKSLGEPIAFVCADKRLNVAAVAEGLRVVPENQD